MPRTTMSCRSVVPNTEDPVVQTERFVIDGIDFGIDAESRTLRRRPSDGRLHVGVKGGADALAELRAAGRDPEFSLYPPILNIEGVDYLLDDDGMLVTDSTLDPGKRISEVYVYAYAHRKLSNYVVRVGHGWVTASGTIDDLIDRPVLFDIAFTCDAAKDPAAL